MRATVNKAVRSISLLAFVGAVGLLVNFSATSAWAQNRATSPHLGDLMNEAMQVHHTKLWLAGRANNWPLAGHEVRKLKDTMEEIKETIVEIQKASPKWQSVPVGELLANIDSRLNDLNRAVDAKDTAKFETAYRALTTACNVCHMRAGESQIKIIEPAAAASSPYIDQDFSTGGATQ
jgi:cytochrome c553